MNYFKLNIGDFLKATKGYSLLEQGAYVALLIEYFASEGLPAGDVCAKIGVRRAADRRAVARVLADSNFAKTFGLVISNYQKNAEANRQNGSKGGRPKVSPKTQVVPKNNPNQEPGTIKYAAAAAAPGPFNECLTLLIRAHPDIPQARWRPIIGKLRQVSGGDDAKVVAAVQRCTALGITDPVPWLMAALKPPPVEETFTSYRKMYQQ